MFKDKEDIEKLDWIWCSGDSYQGRWNSPSSVATQKCGFAFERLHSCGTRMLTNSPEGGDWIMLQEEASSYMLNKIHYHDDQWDKINLQLFV